MQTRITVIFLLLAILCTTTEAYQNWFQRRSRVSEQRSMASAVMDYMDYVFPKDDFESEILKWVFSMLTEDSLL